MQPDTYGMVQADSGQLQERLEKIEAPQQKNNQNDTLYVKNIDVDCGDTTYEPVRISQRWRDPESGRVVTTFPDITYDFNHSEKFQVRWAGQVIELKPGEIKRMPRYIGEHFASQLADHILGKRGLAQGKMLVNSPIERPKVLREIIIKEEPFIFSMTESVGEQTIHQIEELNKPEVTGIQGEQYANGGPKEQNLGEADATPTNSVITPVGVLSKTEVEPTEDVVKRLEEGAQEDSSNIPEDWKNYTKKELVELIRNMAPDYKFGHNVSKAQLVDIVRRF